MRRYRQRLSKLRDGAGRDRHAVSMPAPARRPPRCRPAGRLPPAAIARFFCSPSPALTAAMPCERARGTPDRLTVLLLAKLGAGGRHAIAFAKLRQIVLQSFTLASLPEIFYLLGTDGGCAALRPILDFAICFSTANPHQRRPLANNSCASAFCMLLPGLTALIFCSWLIAS